MQYNKICNLASCFQPCNCYLLCGAAEWKSGRHRSEYTNQLAAQRVARCVFHTFQRAAIYARNVLNLPTCDDQHKQAESSTCAILAQKVRTDKNHAGSSTHKKSNSMHTFKIHHVLCSWCNELWNPGPRANETSQTTCQFRASSLPTEADIAAKHLHQETLSMKVFQPSSAPQCRKRPKQRRPLLEALAALKPWRHLPNQMWPRLRWSRLRLPGPGSPQHWLAALDGRPQPYPGERRSCAGRRPKPSNAPDPP